MRKISIEQKRLISEYLANIGVAWFAAGVIGVFIGSYKEPGEILRALVWGVGLSSFFLWSGYYLLNNTKP